MAKAQKAKGKKRTRKAPKPDYVMDLTGEAEEYIAVANDLIDRYELGEEDDYGNPVDEERLIARMYEIHSELGELEEEGWEGYRDAMDALSNRLWQVGIAWPQHLPYWSWADVVLPEDLKMEISSTCIYQKDLIAIRKYADSQMWRFKDTVHLLVEHARKTIDGFSMVEKESKPRCRRKTTKITAKPRSQCAAKPRIQRSKDTEWSYPIITVQEKRPCIPHLK